jgi:hypothetical protein
LQLKNWRKVTLDWIALIAPLPVPNIDKTPHETHNGKVSIKYKKFRKKYSIADAWINGNIAKYQQKLSGRRSAGFKFLYPYLE